MWDSYYSLATQNELRLTITTRIKKINEMNEPQDVWENYMISLRKLKCNNK